MAKDLYKYFRIEARELLDSLAHGALELEKGSADTSTVTSLLRLAHTLKGASRVVRQGAIAEAAHAVEDVLSPYREGEARVPKESAAEMLRLLDQIAVKLAALESPEATGMAAGPSRPSSEETLETVRVEVEEIDALLGSLSEASVDLIAIQDEMGGMKRARRLASLLAQQAHSRDAKSNGPAGRIRPICEQLLDSLECLERTFASGIERAGRELAQSRELANRLRLLPANAIVPALTRAVRDAAVALGKQAELQFSGSDIRLDAHVLAVLRDVLLHLVRNAVAHGIETEEARIAADKAPAGRVEINVRRRGSRVVFVCRDDGAGIDVGAIRRAAVDKGAISAADAQSLGLHEAVDLILRGGVSTTGRITGISGRGIGLDVVRDAVARLKGDVAIDTTPGFGTVVEICVPVSLTSVLVLTVESAGVIVSLPIESVREVVRIAGLEIVRSGAGESIPYQGQAIPFLTLSQALGRAAPTGPCRERRSAIIVTSGPALAAVGVERLLRTGTVLVRSLPGLAAAAPVVAGGSLNAEGNPVLVLDPGELVEAAHKGQEAREPSAVAAQPPILVIDDSLTTRMVEQSILESAGHRVELATSAEEALEKAHTRPYGLFLVDVEMPGMDGFQFLARTRDDPLLRDTPSILVTSRDSADDRRRGEEVGARAYIVKSEFDQGYLLETIQQLMR